ncbi:MAG: 3D domain-containing protein [Endomicrobiia bacterium]|nr:MAG: 3D domain-containing protein [Endomicrobiia bacterium]
MKKIKFIVINLLKLFFVVFSILSLSKCLASINSMLAWSYIVVGKTIHTLPFRNISLKMILDGYNILLNSGDIISHDINKPIKPIGSSEKVNIMRVTKKQRKFIVNVPFKIVWSMKYNLNLRNVELQKCVKKNIMKTVEEVFHDGDLYNTNVVNEDIRTKKYYRLVLFNSNNAIERIYDLSKARKMEMIATAYYPGDPLAWKDGKVTFLGHKMQRGIVAVDPKIIPLKTRLFIPGYGYGYAGDTGGLIKGNRVDLGVNNVKEEKNWMFKNVVVYILGKSEKY